MCQDIRTEINGVTITSITVLTETEKVRTDKQNNSLINFRRPGTLGLYLLGDIHTGVSQ